MLNRPVPDDPANPPSSNDVINIDISPPTESKVRRAIKATKNGKAAGIDPIHAEMLMADLNTSSVALIDLSRDKDIIHEDWSKGLIVKFPKKGNLQNCDNWRGITLLSRKILQS